MKVKVKAVQLWGNLMVLERESGKQRGRTKIEGTPEEIIGEEFPERLKREQARKKREREQEQRYAEQVQIKGDNEVIKWVIGMNNAGLRHIGVFINLVKYAEEHKLPVLILEMKKRLTEENAVKEWATVRNWLGKNAPKICAVTIGRRPRGWWVLRWIVLGEEPEEDCYRTASALHTYLMMKRNWITQGITGEQEAGRLKEHYLTRLEDDSDTLYLCYAPEMYEVYRAALAMPKSTRTYRTEQAYRILEERKLKVSGQAAYAVNGIQGASPSGMALCEVEVSRGRVNCAYSLVWGREESADEW